MTTDKISIFICDDQPIFREGLKTFLSIQSNLHLVGEAQNGKEALTAILKHKPMVCIIDLSMPILDGTELLEQLRKNKTDAKFIVLSQHHEKHWILKLLATGVDAFILKSDGRDYLLDAIWAISKGERYFSPTIANIFYQMLHSEHNNKSIQMNKYELSSREKEVARLTSMGMTVREIATNLNCSQNTIKTHKSNLMKKLNTKNAAEVTSWVLKYLD